jgi:hypothetical protein
VVDYFSQCLLDRCWGSGAGRIELGPDLNKWLPDVFRDMEGNAFLGSGHTIPLIDRFAALGQKRSDQVGSFCLLDNHIVVSLRPIIVESGETAFVKTTTALGN